KININADRPSDVYSAGTAAPERNVDFLKDCVRLIPIINFADQRSGKVYARMEHGQLTWCDEAKLEQVLKEPDARAGFDAIGAGIDQCDDTAQAILPALEKQKTHTLGAWGPEA
ncbi:MAG: hypothetical protein ACR2OM_09950, partial [Aestuariivirgaceae bacterium]